MNAVLKPKDSLFEYASKTTPKVADRKKAYQDKPKETEFGALIALTEGESYEPSIS